MSTPQQPQLLGDGTSQANRHAAALAPEFVSVDERTLEDLLMFARQFAGELKYFNEENRHEGTWEAFFGKSLDVQMLEQFLADPGQVPFDHRAFFSRPHFVLFLVFLHLYGEVQEDLNGITARHLDFYYREVLGFEKKCGTPDRVHVLAGLNQDASSLLIPKGRLLHAGTDDLGKDIFFQVDQDRMIHPIKTRRTTFALCRLADHRYSRGLAKQGRNQRRGVFEHVGHRLWTAEPR